ncbi:MAG TPA: hypothetical protein VME17_13645 [Bryobacteraceae bacterium]|nr:hypothetical protein [Bryobacteraceae bacterium]
MAVSPRTRSPGRSLAPATTPAPLFQRASLSLSWVLLVCGIATALSTAWIVHQTFSPILFFDQWGVVNQMMQGNGHLSLAQLWQQHNEHRIPWGKIAVYADLKFFGGRNISLLIEIYLIQAMEALFLAWMFRRYRKSNPVEIATAAALFLFAMFYPIQIENFYWGFQVAFVTLPWAAAVSIGAMIVHSEHAASREPAPWFSWPLAVSLAAAIVAETSLASGLLLWPVLLFVSFALRMPAKTKCLIAGVGVLAVGAFLWGYRSPGQTANPLESLHHPLAVAKFMRATLAWSWDSTMPTAALWPDFTELCVMIAVAIVIVALIRTVRPGNKPDKLELFLLANAGFLLLTLLVVALGRMNFGLPQAIASRYQTIALAFWASFGALLLLWSSKAHNPARLVEVQIVFLMLILAGVPRFFSSEATAKAHRRSLAEAYTTLLQDPADSEARGAISPYPNFAEEHAFLESHHLGVDDREFPHVEGILEPVGFSPQNPLKVAGFQVLPADQCAGHLDSVRSATGGPEMVRVSGWGWMLGTPSHPPRKVVLALDDGTVVGSARLSIPRPDVRKQVAGVTELRTGWKAEVSLPPGRALRAFLVADRSGDVCPVQDEFRRR